MFAPGPIRRRREREFIVESTMDAPPVDWCVKYLNYAHVLTDIKWYHRVVRQWPYFWRTKVVWFVELTFLPETEEQLQQRLRKQCEGEGEAKL
jgi:hypothetical protein